MNILLTGATGFVGTAVLESLNKSNYQPVVVVRTNTSIGAAVEKVIVDSVDSNTRWGPELARCDVVIHCAARVHVMDDDSSDPLTEFREVNTYGTLNLARQAADAGVKRFMFISSIKVSGEGTPLNFPYKSSDEPRPVDPYGISKYGAEVGLKEIALETSMEVVIIRPVLVYGPGVKANFLNMMKWLSKGIPLPLGAINNKRSFVALDNLVDLIITCIDHPSAANQIFLVSDDHDVSTTELLQLLGDAMGSKSLLLPVPMGAINFVAKLFGKSDFSQRLCGSLQVDINHTKVTLGWQPPYSVEQSLLKTANAYKKTLK